MDKTALKNFAMYAREKLIKDIEDRARFLGINEDGIVPPLPQSTHDIKIFSIGVDATYRIGTNDVTKYERIIKELEKRQVESDYPTAYKSLIEEVAYTWFNRIIAIRFMEVNNYLPDGLRVLSSGIEGVREPEFVSKYRDTNIGLTKEEFEYLDQLKLDGNNKAMEEMFKFIFIKQCNALNENLPKLFEKTDDYAELLLNISYEDPEGVIRKLVDDIGEEAFDRNKTGQVEIIGWLYQYYNTVAKEEVDGSKKKVDENTLPIKTQLFTPEWIVKYMVENSLGRLWIERKIALGTDKTEKELAKEYGWKYYISEAEQISDVEIQLKYIREDRKDLKLEEIKFIDPAMGSGHVLVYAFDVFMQFYLEEGYTKRQATESIIENNLYGLDIDKRAYQLSYFALMMKARQYSRRILNKDLRNNLRVFQDSKDIDKSHIEYMGVSLSEDDKKKAIKSINYLIKKYINAKEIGSMLKFEYIDFQFLRDFINDRKSEIQLTFNDSNIEKTVEKLENILDTTEILNNKYDVVVTNPPYLGRNHMGVNLTKFLDSEYPNTKSDLFAVFMEKSDDILIKNSYYGMVNQHSWMFLSSFEKYRKNLLKKNNIITMLHLGPRAFEDISGEVVQSTAFAIKKNKVKSYKGSYIRLINFKNAKEKEEKTLEAIEDPSCGYYYETDEDNFKLIPGTPIAYWVSEKFYEIFRNAKSVSSVGEPKQGLITADNERFLRLWHEVKGYPKEFTGLSRNEAKKSGLKWFPYNKGGKFRKWYGNRSYLVNWENDGFEIKNLKDKNGKVKSRPQNLGYQFKEGYSWSSLTSGNLSMRFNEQGSLFDSKGSMYFYKHIGNRKYLLGLLNSVTTIEFLKILSPTLDFNQGPIGNIPFYFTVKYKDEIDTLVESNINISKTDWDSFETSWDFELHPLLDYEKQGQVPNRLEEAYNNWKKYANDNFNKLKENEERLNEIFIEIYGLEDELDKYVSDKDITIAKIFDDKKDIYDDIKGNAYILTKEDVIKSFISYGLGCILGRYSLDEKGLAYAGGEFDINRYKKFKPVEDNIVLITDEEYFEDDLVNRFIEFVEVSFGEENLEENLNFIADSLKGRGTSREKIRAYFVNDFYKDHVKTYKKTPIYWLYDSSAGKGKKQSQNGFKALIYMHRYDADTTGKVRIDYLHKLQKIYERKIDFLNDDIAHNKDAKSIAQEEKELEKIRKQLKECKDYDEKISHIALSRIDIDLDDGVKVNYEKVQTDDKDEKFEILAKI